MPEQNQKRKAVKGVVWSAIEQVAVQGVQFVVSIVLARLLTPADFGLVAIVIVFSQIFQTINESGFNTALVHKQDRDALDFSTSFVANLLIGCVSYALLFLCAPALARFYDNPALVPVMRVLSVSLIIRAVSLVPLAKFTISVDFKTQARASLTASILSGVVGIGVAVAYRNVYAIVAQQLTSAVINALLLCFFARWRPSLAFSWQRFRDLFRYASRLIGARVISVVFDDIYTLAIGKLYTPAVLGCYNRGQAFQGLLSRNIINMVQRVSVPLLCEEQHDYARMRLVLIRFIQMTALVVYPLLAGLMVLAAPLVAIVLGPKWAHVADLLLYICPIAFLYLLGTFNRNVYNATGRTGLALKSEVAKKAVFIGIFLVTMHFSMKVLLLGLILTTATEAVIDMSLARHQIGVTIREELRSLRGIAAATLLMAAAVALVAHFMPTDLLRLAAGTLTGIIIYATVCYRGNVANVRNEIKEYAKKRSKPTV